MVDSRSPFADEFASPDWNYDLHGRPDYVTMRLPEAGRRKLMEDRTDADFDPHFFDKLLADPEKIAAFRAEQIRKAVEHNATLPSEKRVSEEAARANEEWALDLMGIY